MSDKAQNLIGHLATLNQELDSIGTQLQYILKTFEQASGKFSQFNNEYLTALEEKIAALEAEHNRLAAQKTAFKKEAKQSNQSNSFNFKKLQKKKLKKVNKKGFSPS